MTKREVRKIHRSDCADLVLSVHYAKRWPSISYAFGLYKDGVLEGCVTYGTPFSAPLRSGVAGKAYSGHVLELNRLVLRSNQKNDASFLIAASLKQLKLLGNFIVISFADPEQGHAGVVYQAAGFTYHGLSAKRTDWKIRGMEHLHGHTISDKFRGHENRVEAVRAQYGDAFYLHPRPQKHRYIKVLGRRGFVAAATKAVAYKIAPYPK